MHCKLSKKKKKVFELYGMYILSNLFLLKATEDRECNAMRNTSRAKHRPDQLGPLGLNRCLGQVRVQYSGLPWVQVGFRSNSTRPIFKKKKKKQTNTTNVSNKQNYG